MSRIRVGVLRGGIGHEYEVSLATGHSVLSNLSRDIYDPVDLLVTRDGVWHVGGLPIKPEAVPMYVDVIFNALHGEYGEDGQVQRILDSLNVPYTGSGAFASALSINKVTTNKILKENKINVPYSVALEYDGSSMEDYARRVFEKVSPPWIVKPADKGSSVGIFVVKHYPDLPKALEECFSVSDSILVEELLKGKEATCGVVEGFRGKDLYSLPVIEISKPIKSPFWSYEDKYQTDNVRKVCPSCFSDEEKAQIEDLAIKVHAILGLRHYSRTDFILSPRGIYVLETNTLPGLTPKSPLPFSLEVVGSSHAEFVHHLINLALKHR